MKVCSVFWLESRHGGDSNENTIYHFHYIKENRPKLSQICSYGNVSYGHKNEFETAVVNEPSVFEPSKFYCTIIKFWSIIFHKILRIRAIHIWSFLSCRLVHPCLEESLSSFSSKCFHFCCICVEIPVSKLLNWIYTVCICPQKRVYV